MNGWTLRLATIERPVEAVDAASGTTDTTWEPLAPLPGSPVVAEQFFVTVRDVLPGRDEASANGLAMSKNQTDLKMRWRGDVTSAMRVTLHGDSDVIYQIIGGPQEVGGRKKELLMRLERYSS